MKILFQGDSITHAFRQPEEGNPAFQLGNGYAFIIGAQLARDLPGTDLTLINRGVCGEDACHLLLRWQEDAVEHHPDLLSLLIGVNGTVSTMNGQDAGACEEFGAIYRRLLDDVKALNPKVTLLLMEPFLLKAGEVNSDWLEHLRPRQTLIQKIAEEYQALFVPLQSIFDQALIHHTPEQLAWDGIHPSHIGFQLIADAWLRATEALPFRNL